MWGLASAQEETSWSESPSAKLTEVAKGSREAHAHSNPHAWQLLFGIARNGNQTMKRAKECFWSRVWWDVLLEHLCYVFCRYIVLMHDAWTSLNHGHISEKNQSSIKHTDRQAVKMDSCQDVTNNKKTYHTSAHSIDHRVKHSQLAIGNCSASHNVADYQCILGVQHFYYLQSKSLILTSCKHHPKPHQQTRVMSLRVTRCVCGATPIRRRSHGRCLAAHSAVWSPLPHRRFHLAKRYGGGHSNSHRRQWPRTT